MGGYWKSIKEHAVELFKHNGKLKFVINFSNYRLATFHLEDQEYLISPDAIYYQSLTA